MKWLFYIKLVLILTFHPLSILHAQHLVINEVVSSNLRSLQDDTGDNSDWIELYNNGNQSVYLGGYFLSDDEQNTEKWKLPPFHLQPGEYIILYASGKQSLSSGLHTSFKLSSAGESLILSNHNGQSVDAVFIPPLYQDISYGRSVDGGSNWAYFDTPTPANTNNSSVYFECLLPKPVVNLPSGNYTGQVSLTANHIDSEVKLHYTTNGNDPSQNDPVYTTVLNLNSNPDVLNYSSIPTNPSLNFPLPGYTETRANNRGWVPPFTPSNVINVIKIQARKQGCIPSETVARTFLIDEQHNLPVLSIQSDSIGLFSDENGIYVWGNDYFGNYNRSGLPSERASHIDYIDNNGIIFSEQAGIRIGGGGSRHSTQKNLNVFLRGAYGNSHIEEDIFSESDLERWKRLTIRSGGHRPDCLSKDEFASRLVEKLPVTHSKYRYSSTYINGEYWGIHAIKERMNPHYLSEYYNLPKDSIVFLGSYGRILDGTEQDSVEYAELMDFVRNNNLNISTNYDSLLTHIDIDNFRDYAISQIFLGNADWPNSNIKFWKKRTKPGYPANAGHDGKWRWVLFDLDGSFGGTCNDVYVTFNTLNWALQTDSNFEKYTVLFVNLIENDGFKTDFINRTCDLINSSFKASVTRPKLQSVKDTVNMDVDNHLNRWRYPSTSSTLLDRYNEVPSRNQWDYLTSQMDTFLMERPHYVRKHMFDEWGLSDSVRLSVNVNDQNMGSVQVSSIIINENLEGTSTNVYPWTGVYFSDLNIPLKAIPKEGYRFVEWIETGSTEDLITINLSADSTYTALFEPDPDYVPLLPLVINEIQSGNQDTYMDEYGEFDDWIEIYNPNDTSVNLKGHYLTDDPANLTKYAIDNDIFVGAKSHLILWCDQQNEQGLSHTNFKLKREGEFIGLVSKNQQGFSDSITFPYILQNHSYGRSFDGSPEWISFKIPTPNAPNEIIEIPEKEPYDLVIYPNPNKDGILYFSKTISGELYSGEGKLIMTFEEKKQIDIGFVSQGVYLLRTELGINRRILLID